MKMLPITQHEWLFTHPQPQQIAKQTGSVGGMFLELSPDQGNWHISNARSYSVASIDQESNLLAVLKNFREKGKPLCDNESLNDCIEKNPSLTRTVKDSKQLCFKVVCEDCTYFIRGLFQYKYSYGAIFCYCFGYKTDMLNHHLNEAGKGISFLGKNNSAIHIEDGQEVSFWMQNVRRSGYVRYVTDKQVLINDRIYDIRTFARKYIS